jgi:hypothetical protein
VARPLAWCAGQYRHAHLPGAAARAVSCRADGCRWVNSAGVPTAAPVILGRCSRNNDFRRPGSPTSTAVLGSRRDLQQEKTPPTGSDGRVAIQIVGGRIVASRVAANPTASGRSLVVGRASCGSSTCRDLHASMGHPDRRGARDHRRPDNNLDRRDTGHPGWLGHDRADGPGNADRHRRLRGHHRDHAVGAE